MEKPKATRADPEARKAYTRWHYQQNKALYKARASAGRDKTRSLAREAIQDYLASHPCVDCGENDPIVLEFDHRGDKLFNIGDAIRLTLTVKKIMAEIAKCDVRCANCHRRKTHADRVASALLTTKNQS